MLSIAIHLSKDSQTVKLFVRKNVVYWAGEVLKCYTT